MLNRITVATIAGSALVVVGLTVSALAFEGTFDAPRAESEVTAVVEPRGGRALAGAGSEPFAGPFADDRRRPAEPPATPAPVVPAPVPPPVGAEPVTETNPVVEDAPTPADENTPPAPPAAAPAPAAPAAVPPPAPPPAAVPEPPADPVMPQPAPEPEPEPEPGPPAEPEDDENGNGARWDGWEDWWNDRGWDWPGRNR